MLTFGAEHPFHGRLDLPVDGGRAPGGGRGAGRSRRPSRGRQRALRPLRRRSGAGPLLRDDSGERLHRRGHRGHRRAAQRRPVLVRGPGRRLVPRGARHPLRRVGPPLHRRGRRLRPGHALLAHGAGGDRGGRPGRMRGRRRRPRESSRRTTSSPRVRAVPGRRHPVGCWPRPARRADVRAAAGGPARRRSQGRRAVVRRPPRGGAAAARLVGAGQVRAGATWWRRWRRSWPSSRWLAGDGALAWCALERAAEGTPPCTLADRRRRGARAGLAPGGVGAAAVSRPLPKAGHPP